MLSILEPKGQITPLSQVEAQNRRGKSLAIALVLIFLVGLFYAVTLVRLKGNVASRGTQLKSDQLTGDNHAGNKIAPAKKMSSSAGKQAN